MRRISILLLVFCTCFALAAWPQAQGNDNGVILSKDGRMTISTNPPAKGQPYVEDNAGLTTIYDNLGGHYPDGVYWCCTGLTIMGPDNKFGAPEYWEAAAFTPATSLSVTKISVALGIGNAGEKFTDIMLSLANDNGGIPGTAIKTWKVRGMPSLGSCCTVKTKTDFAGIPVAAGTQYWITVTTETDSDVLAAWNLNDTKQLAADAINEAYYCYSTGSGCAYNGVWVSSPTYPGLAFGVWGK